MPLNDEAPDEIDATILLGSILAQPVGTIANIIQAALELDGTLHERLSKGYYELTNSDPAAETDGIRLRDDEEDGDAPV